MSVYQDWQKERDAAKEKLEEAEEHLRKSVKEAKDSPEPSTEEFRRNARRSSIEILDILDNL